MGKTLRRRCHVCDKVMTINGSAFKMHLRFKCEPPKVSVLHLPDRSHEPLPNQFVEPAPTLEKHLLSEADWVALHGHSGKQ